uniref:Uncharacterized protein n=1 Tax=Plectus sambesii TaxID=2011161 RepID=A0A914WD73_9BILA
MTGNRPGAGPSAEVSVDGGGGIGRALINGPTAADRRRSGVVSRVPRPPIRPVRCVPGRRFGRSPSCVVRALSRAFRRWRFFKLATKRRRLGGPLDCEIMEMVAARVTYWAHLSPKPPLPPPPPRMRSRPS